MSNGYSPNGKMADDWAPKLGDQPRKLLTDPYEAACQWAFGSNWRNLMLPQAIFQYEVRHFKKLPPGIPQAALIKLIASEWSRAVKEGKDSDMIIKDAIDKAVEGVNG